MVSKCGQGPARSHPLGTQEKCKLGPQPRPTKSESLVRVGSVVFPQALQGILVRTGAWEPRTSRLTTHKTKNFPRLSGGLLLQLDQGALDRKTKHWHPSRRPARDTEAAFFFFLIKMRAGGKALSQQQGCVRIVSSQPMVVPNVGLI